MPSEGGIGAYFWKAAFLDGGIIPSRAGMIRLSGGITPSEGGRMHQFGHVNQRATTYLQEGGTMPSEGGTAAYFQIQQFSLVGGIFHS